MLFALFEHRAVDQCDRITVEVDRSLVGQTCDRTVAGQIPSRSALDGDHRVIRYGGIARSIAEGHHGTIRAELPDGKTIIFTAELR